MPVTNPLQLQLNMQKVSKQINECLDTDDRTSEGYITGLLIAHTCSYKASMPSSPVDKPTQWYMENVNPAVEVVLRDVSKTAVIDVSVTLSNARDMWLARYSMLHMPESRLSVEYSMRAIAGSDSGVEMISAKNAHIMSAVMNKDTLVDQIRSISAFINMD